MSNRGRQRGTGFGALKYQRTGTRWQPCHELIKTQCPAENLCASEIELVFCIDDTGSMGPAIANVQAQVSAIVNYVAANYTTRRFGLISFKDSTTSELTFSDNNEAAFITAVDALVASGGDTSPENVDGALADAVALTWTAEYEHRVIVITDAIPGGTDSIHDAADVTNLNTQATNGLANDSIETSFILVPGGARTDESRVIYTNAAALGGGVFVESASAAVPASILALLEDSCEQSYQTRSDINCCRTANCTICVVATEYDGTVYYGSLLWDDDNGYWEGTIAGATMRIWDQVKGECFEFVRVDGVVVAATKHCDDYGVSQVDCRDRSGDISGVSIVIDEYETIDVDITYYTKKPLRWRYDGCEPACFSRCLPREFCLTATCGELIYSGIFTADEEECEAGTLTPIWRGTAETSTGESVTGTFELGHDAYEICVMSGSLTGDNYITLEETVVTPGTSMTVSWIDEPCAVTIVDADCGDCSPGEACPDGCCFAPDTLTPNAPPAYGITLVLTAPNCPNLDGLEIDVNVIGGGVAKDCGFCVSWGTSSAVGDATGTNSTGPNPTPCSKAVFLVLDCDNDLTAAPANTDICCANARLRGALTTGGGGIAEENWDTLAILPMISCACDDAYPPPLPPGMSAVWDASFLADLLPDCVWDLPARCTDLTGATFAL